MGWNRPAVDQREAAVREFRLNGRLFVGRRNTDRPPRTEIDRDEGFGICGKAQRRLGAQKFDDEETAFERGDAPDPQLGIEAVREMGPRSPAELRMVSRQNSTLPHSRQQERSG